ncbi:cytochrome P450 [Kibdelosporangium banguiense]|uniref:Cytochrome P450 n=1 Tax=Kibdelosporangium banguiense TaxID=1365924 RepID=A0ABS4U0Z2_9PSEU|nr:cytochrome P450 [Kibdelosporangium banguiense]MBP2329870.1 cytochrome P450 [Kibdelosporangium banguiense]
MTDLIEPDALLFNPFMPGFFEDPYPQYKMLRDEDPVQNHPLGFWFVSRFDDVSALLKAGLSVEVGNLAPGVMMDQLDSLGIEDGKHGVLNMSMLDRDPPDHTRLRSLVTKVFTRRAVAALEPKIVALVDAVLDRMAEKGSFDLVEELAFPLPFAVISEMLGMPPTDHARIRELSGTLVRSLEVVTDEEVARAIVNADIELAAITRDLIEWKRANPGDDLLTALIAAEHEGQVLNGDELVAQVVLLYVAGHETTVNLIANGVNALLRNPDQLALLRERPDLAGNAVEEFLRYDSPVQQTRRITTAPYTLRDKEIPAGTFVLACLGSANRDERFFGADAGELRIDRPEARHQVSFGAGPHHCLGAALARLEGQVAVSRLVQRFPDLAFDGQLEWNGRINLRGPAKFPVRAT